jgi:RNA polymerase sigma-70 factor (ECF subfamily)
VTFVKGRPAREPDDGASTEEPRSGGGLATMETLFRRYRPSVLRRATAILGNSETAKDAVQEVFLRAMRSRPEWIESPSPMAWLYRVTTNLCLNWLRDVARRRKVLATSLPVGWHAPGDTLVVVRALLRNLTPAAQEIAIYYFVDQMSQNEISELMGISRRTVGHRLERIRAAALSM